METPLVSIIIPVYNVEAYLPACIDSLLNQTYPNLEIICVDDGSTDASPAVLQAYAQKYRHVRIIRQENGGAGAARNRGLEAASGVYVTFLDGDDWLELNTIETCVQQAQHTGADIVCFGFRFVRKSGAGMESAGGFEYKTGCFAMDDHLKSFFAENSPRKERLNTATMGKLYQRSLLEQHNIRFRLSAFEDTPFFLEAVYHAKKIARVSGALYNYLMREKDAAAQSTMGAAVSTGKLSGFYAADAWIEDFLKAKNIFKQYRKPYHRFHNGRVLLYGGYFEVYVHGKGQNEDAVRIFLEQLHIHRNDITFHRKGLYRVYRKRIFWLKAGLWLYGFNPRLAHRLYMSFERTLAPK